MFNLAEQNSFSAAVLKDTSSGEKKKKEKKSLSQHKYNGSINLVSIELSSGSPICTGR